MNETNSFSSIYKSIELPFSKSVINRFLVLKYLYDDYVDINLDENTADDSILLNNILKENIPQQCNCKNAGTVFRFILAVSALDNNQRVIGGSERMHNRPCKDLVDALQSLGAKLKYLKNDGYPPIQIISPINKGDYPKEITINSTISSQFVSAIMMIAPLLSNGLTIKTKGDNVSFSYIKMTSRLMNIIGLENHIKSDSIYINPKKDNLNFNNFSFERDWSAAAFWVTILSAYERGEMILKDLTTGSMQGDEKLLDYLPYLNIDYQIVNSSTILSKKDIQKSPLGDLGVPEFTDNFININLKDCPDLFPALAVAFAINNIQVQISGLNHTQWKESNRLCVVVDNLKKLNYNVEMISDGIKINKSDNNIREITESIMLNSHDDHRIAMSFAIFELINTNINITNKASAEKSYPSFFNQFSIK